MRPRSATTVLTVLSNIEQYEMLKRHYPRLEKIKIISDSPAFYSFLKNNHIDFDTLDENDIQEHWRSINEWACEKALLWEELIADRGSFFDGIEMAKALYVFFSFYLVTLLKNYLFADHIYRKYHTDEVIVFKGMRVPDFPYSNGNYFLNIFLEFLGTSREVKLHSFACTRKATRLPINFKEHLKRIVQKVYGKFFPCFSKEMGFLVYGSLRHMERLIKELKGRGKNSMLYDTNFNFKQLRFCLQERLTYMVPECYSYPSGGDTSINKRYEQDFSHIVGILKAKRWFTYNGVDLSPFICKEMLEQGVRYLQNISLWSQSYTAVLNAHKVEGLIINEDLSPKGGFMAAFFKSHGVKVFCISHAYGPIRFSLPSAHRKFSLSETFVHSEYEKSIYVARGWIGEHIHVSGIPRYDGLRELKQKTPAKGAPSNQMRIMFCGGIILDYTPEDASLNNWYMGIVRLTIGQNMRNCLGDLIEAIDPQDIIALVKPHYNNDRELWMDFIQRHKKGNNILFVPAERDFFSVLSQCQVMVIGYWSTAIIEAVIFGIPVVVIDYTGLEAPHPFEREGLCTVVRDKQELKKVIGELYSTYLHSAKRGWITNAKTNHAFYTGINDGKNTQRVVEEIIKSGPKVLTHAN